MQNSVSFNDDWQQLPFSQCIDKISIKHKVKQKEYLDSGKYPVIDQAQKFISGYCNDEIAVKITKPIIVFGDHTRCFKFVDFNFVAGADGIHILQPKDFFNEKLFYYFCLALDFPNKGYSRHYQYLAKTIMKIPPLEIQKRIVKRLDEAFARIESGTKHLQSAKDNLIKYKQSLLKSAFNGTLTNESTKSTHPLAPSAREGERESCHALKSPLPQHEGHLGVGNTRNDENSPYLAEGARRWVKPCNDNALDCHADKSAHNDDKDCHTERSEVSKDKGVDFVDTSAFSKPQYDKILDSRNDDKDSLNDKSANLPQGWTIKTLGEVCEINPKNKLDDNLEVSFIPMNLILDKFQNKFSYETKIWKNIKKGYTHLQNNCIALAKITPCFENGKCVILDDLKNGYGAGTTELIILLPNAQKAFVKYIFYFLNTQSFIEQGKRNFKGTAGQLRIGTDFVSNCKIPIPPLETQKQIVEILERHFTSADKVGVYIESCLTKAKQLKSSLLKSAFEGTLTNETTHPLAPSASEGEEVDCYESLCDSHNEDKAK